MVFFPLTQIIASLNILSHVGLMFGQTATRDRAAPNYARIEAWESRQRDRGDMVGPLRADDSQI